MAQYIQSVSLPEVEKAYNTINTFNVFTTGSFCVLQTLLKDNDYKIMACLITTV